MTKTYTIKASPDAIRELKTRVAEDPGLYKGRGMTGALDMALFGEFRTTGCGNNWGGRKNLQKLCKTRGKKLKNKG